MDKKRLRLAINQGLQGVKNRYDVDVKALSDSNQNEYMNGYDDENIDTVVVMEEIARRRGCIKKGGKIDYDKVSVLILDEFRKGILGKISLEEPEN